MTIADASAYLQSWAEELAARANRVRNLIGDAHWVSDGNHKESLLREFISRHLPKNFVVSNGFIRSTAAQDNCSPEVDILIADSSAHAPLFSESELYISAPVAVAAHVEVKTSFSKSTLMSALRNICASQTIISANSRPERVWRAILFYNVPDSREPESLIATLKDALEELEQEVHQGSKTKIGNLLPTCIASLSDWVIFLAPTADQTISLRFFQTEGLSAACAMVDLFASIRRWSGGAVTGDFDRMIESLPLPNPIVITINFPVR